MTKAMLKTMAAIALVAAFMLVGASRIAWRRAQLLRERRRPRRTSRAPRASRCVAVEVDGAKFWLPSVIAVDQGDKVKLTLKNQVPGAENQHGFTIPAYNITEVVTRGEPKIMTLRRRQAGRLSVFLPAASRAYRRFVDRRTQEVAALPESGR